METRVKERLVGAIVLVTLIVVVVPMLLSGPQTAPQRPDAPRGGTRSVAIDLTGDEPQAPEDPSHPQPEPEPEPARSVPASAPVAGIRTDAASAPDTGGPPAIAPTGLPPVEAGAPTLQTAPPPARPGPSTAAAGAESPPTAAMTPKPAATTPAAAAVKTSPAPPPEVARPAPRPAPPPPATAASRAPAAWAVQLGAFSTREAALKLVSELKAKGYAAFSLEYRSGGKVLYRVRVGPEQDRSRAEAIAARLSKDGFKASVAPHP